MFPLFSEHSLNDHEDQIGDLYNIDALGSLEDRRDNHNGSEHDSENEYNRMVSS